MWSEDSCLSRNCCVSCVGDYRSPQRPTWQHRKCPLWIGGRYGEVAGRGWGGGGCKMTSSVSVLLGSNVLH